MTRTHDLLITNQLHYRLCYTSDFNIIIQKSDFVKDFFIRTPNFFHMLPILENGEHIILKNLVEKSYL